MAHSEIWSINRRIEGGIEAIIDLKNNFIFSDMAGRNTISFVCGIATGLLCFSIHFGEEIFFLYG